MEFVFRRVYYFSNGLPTGVLNDVRFNSKLAEKPILTQCLHISAPILAADGFRP